MTYEISIIPIVQTEELTSYLLSLSFQNAELIDKEQHDLWFNGLPTMISVLREAALSDLIERAIPCLEKGYGFSAKIGLSSEQFSKLLVWRCAA